jgi:hypothetical protein
MISTEQAELRNYGCVTVFEARPIVTGDAFRDSLRAPRTYDKSNPPHDSHSARLLKLSPNLCQSMLPLNYIRYHV